MIMLTRIKAKLGFSTLMRLLHFYPPLMGAGVRIRIMDPTHMVVKVSMPLRFYNQNMFGSHYGGSIFSMCDPFVPLILFYKLGKKYRVRDKHTEIQFLKPGRGVIHSTFQVDDSSVQEIESNIKKEGKAEPVFVLEVKDQENEVVARIKKTIWIKP
ncbi:MAG: DUF4442 domain-containing protein [Bdellovibrionota bacterium]